MGKNHFNFTKDVLKPTGSALKSFGKESRKTFSGVANYIKPVSKPLIGALTNKLVGNINGISDSTLNNQLQAGIGANGGVPAFKKGGRVKGIRNKAKVAIVHGGEVIIPNSMPALQKSALKKIKSKK
jgi:hypothetical protein